jgi:integrase
MKIQYSRVDTVDTKNASAAPGPKGALNAREAQAVLSCMAGASGLLVRLLCGLPLQLLEGLRLRVKDVDFTRGVLVVRNAKRGRGQDRIVALPRALQRALAQQVDQARTCWESDRRRGVAGVRLPNALDLKHPAAAQSWEWFWVFPSPTLSADPRAAGLPRRQHLHEMQLQRELEKALCAASIAGPVTVHALRHTMSHKFIDRGLQAGADVPAMALLPRHGDAGTAMANAPAREVSVSSAARLPVARATIQPPVRGPGGARASRLPARLLSRRAERPDAPGDEAWRAQGRTVAQAHDPQAA